MKKIQSEILKAICSKSLFDTIEKKSFEMQDFDLLILAYRYAPTYDRLIELLSYIVSSTKDERTKSQAEKCITYKEDEFKKFISDEKDCVFEAIIKEKPKAIEERFLAKTYQGAYNKVKLFCKEYNIVFDKSSLVEIFKRKATDDLSPKQYGFDEDEQGRIRLNAKLEIKDVDHYSFDDERKWLCSTCKCYDDEDEKLDTECFLHRDPELPKFVKHLDLITYCNSYLNEYYGATKYAINMEWSDDDGSDLLKTDSNYCIELDKATYKHAMSIKSKDDYEKGILFGHHTHIDYVNIDLVSYGELPEEIKKTYDVFMKLYKQYDKR
ncbi:MAG: hypothetical protein FWC80_02290 [Firmicutes bacterium]|nr:hypothetical protein [Bacillota bacterium]